MLTSEQRLAVIQAKLQQPEFYSGKLIAVSNQPFKMLFRKTPNARLTTSADA